MVDFRTVQLLQSRCPATNRHDAKFVEEQMRENNLFPKITFSTTRAQILQELLKILMLIPSLATFFEDSKWLEPVAKIIRKLLPPKCKKSTRFAMFQRFAGSNHKAAVIRVKDRH